MKHSNGRRNFMATSVQSVGLAALGGMLWSGYTDSVKASPLVLRPPGALKEEDFLAACIKCGLCAEACVNRETNIDRDTGKPRPGTLQMAKGGDSLLIGTPFFVPTEVPCYMCEDIPCVPVCPSGALDMPSLINEKNELDINKASMGLAVVHKESCIAYWGIQCDACYRACPLLDVAITLEYQKNPRTGKHAFLLPVVHDDPCTGCGLCEQACVTEEPAIFVLPNDIAKGKTGDHYVKGWDSNDQKRVKDATSKETKTNLSKDDADDYLNSEVAY
ncbi:MAG: Ferredoxin-type protein NapG (periplasmic nitrate reductase) [uncultured Sulfurovum sp.]|uniref:Ferredoxin-type protein NapG (Periplasmic nitrate reductase) n=1 Tax=uncultured Sulfurovum sp. TaxID=269237 RepID=A0A6S6TTM7_9BACT|nr:MAG: Ferredoxin-type protein NapG (periplasmic nitrate reductase) [uncultured Sulfurovum sp.]